MRVDEAVSLARITIKENVKNTSNRSFPVIIDSVKLTKTGYEIRSLNPAGWWIFISFLKEILIYKKGR